MAAGAQNPRSGEKTAPEGGFQTGWGCGLPFPASCPLRRAYLVREPVGSLCSGVIFSPEGAFPQCWRMKCDRPRGHPLPAASAVPGGKRCYRRQVLF